MSKLLEIIILVGIVFALFMAILILSKKNKSIADKVLSIWMFFVSISFLDFYLTYFENIALKYPHTAAVVFPLALTHTPLLYIYTRTMIKPYSKFPISQLLHFIPFGVMYISLIPFYLKSGGEKLQIVESILNNDFPVLYNIFLYLLYVIGPAYIISALVLIRSHRRNIKYTFSYTDKIDLDWIRFIIVGVCIIWIIIFIFDSFDSYLERAFDSNLYTSLSGTVFVMIMGYYGMKQTTIFSNLKYDDFQKIISDQSLDKKRDQYKKSTLKKKDKSRYLDQLKSLMDNEKLYLQPKFSLFQLAQKMDISTNHLSQIINEELGKNFFEFINQYRIEEVKRKLIDPENKNYTLVTIAYESGFNSKSSFNDVFKRYTGQTPKEYLVKKSEFSSQ